MSKTRIEYKKPFALRTADLVKYLGQFADSADLSNPREAHLAALCRKTAAEAITLNAQSLGTKSVPARVDLEPQSAYFEPFRLDAPFLDDVGARSNVQN